MDKVERPGAAQVLRASAARLREMAAALERDADALDGARQTWDLVPAAAVRDALSDDQRFEVDSGFKDPEPPSRPAAPSLREPEAMPTPRRERRPLADRIVEHLREHGAVGRADLAKALDVSPAAVSIALAALQQGGSVERHGPVRGPGVYYRMRFVPPTVAEPAPRQADPEALPRAEDLKWDNVRPVRAAPPPVAPAMIVDARPAAPPRKPPNPDAETIKLNMALDELLDAGDRGMQPSRLREALGVDTQRFDAIVARLIDKQLVSKVPREDGSSGKVYVLRVTGMALREARAAL